MLEQLYNRPNTLFTAVVDVVDDFFKKIFKTITWKKSGRGRFFFCLASKDNDEIIINIKTLFR